MLDDIVEFAAEILLDGCAEILGSKHIPVWLRIIAGGILGVVITGMLALGVWLLGSGISKTNVLTMVIGVVLIVISIVFLLLGIRKLNR